MARVGTALCLLILSTQTLAADSDCQTCHLSGAATDFSQTFTQEKTHHPVDKIYPSSSTYRQADARSGEIAFFDHNHNGLPDPDEIQLFERAGQLQIECASCHDPQHGSIAVQPSHLRNSNDGSALCLTCHIQ